MGLNDTQPNMQNAGLTGIDRLAYNAMFPQSQMDKTQYAVPSQLPTSAETVASDYDAKTDAYTGLPNTPFKKGGLAGIPRYDGEDGSVVTDAPAPEANPDLANLLIDEDRARELNALKASDPKAYNSQLMNELSKTIKSQYNTNSNYDKTWKQFADLQSTDPKAWYKNQLDFLGHQTGWQIGQNTSERNAALQPQIQSTIEDAKKAGLGEDEINQILSGSQRAGNIQNQQRIAQEAAGGGGFGDLMKVAAPIALSMIAGPEVLALMPELGAVGAGALTGGTVGGLGAGLTGGDVGKGILMGGATGAFGGAMNGIDPSIAEGLKGINTAKSLYNVAQSGGKNLSSDINAFKGIYGLAPTSAAHGGLMAAGGLPEVSHLGGYSDGGRLLKGPGDGMSDNIPASIGDKQPARLADGEFVVPADVVSHLGNGSTDAGAKQLYAMMDRVRKARTGNHKQGKQINPNKFLPKG